MFVDRNAMSNPMDERLAHDIYLTLDTNLSCSKITGLFASAGWSSRMCSWTEHEITSDFAELIIASERPILISGGIDRVPESVDKILSILDAASLNYSYEVYDENDSLLRSRP